MGGPEVGRTGPGIIVRDHAANQYAAHSLTKGYTGPASVGLQSPSGPFAIIGSEECRPDSPRAGKD